MSILTTVVGSYPTPQWLFNNTSRGALRDAIMVVLKTQELAGIDVVADGEFGDAGSDLLDDSAALVAEDDRILLPPECLDERRIHRHVAGDHVLIGMTHAAGYEADEDLVLLRVVEFDLLDDVVGMGGVQHCGPSSHWFPF